MNLFQNSGALFVKMFLCATTFLFCFVRFPVGMTHANIFECLSAISSVKPHIRTFKFKRLEKCLEEFDVAGLEKVVDWGPEIVVDKMNGFNPDCMVSWIVGQDKDLNEDEIYATYRNFGKFVPLSASNGSVWCECPCNRTWQEHSDNHWNAQFFIKSSKTESLIKNALYQVNVIKRFANRNKTNLDIFNENFLTLLGSQLDWVNTGEQFSKELFMKGGFRFILLFLIRFWLNHLIE